MKKLSTLIVASVLSFSLAACEELSKQDVGAVTGGVLGGALGSTVGKGSGQIAAVVGGTLIGALIGGSIGKTMDDVDRIKMMQALETAPSNAPVSWVNPDSGNSYTVVPAPAMVASNGQPCREYTTTAVIGTRHEQIYGKACRDAAGNWKVVS